MAVNDSVAPEKLQKYFSLTKKALEEARQHITASPERRQQALEFLDMAQRYYDDAQYFLQKKKDAVLAFAAVNYAHGWLDAGARIGLFEVRDSSLFAVDTPYTTGVFRSLRSFPQETSKAHLCW